MFKLYIIDDDHLEDEDTMFYQVEMEFMDRRKRLANTTFIIEPIEADQFTLGIQELLRSLREHSQAGIEIAVLIDLYDIDGTKSEVQGVEDYAGRHLLKAIHNAPDLGHIAVYVYTKSYYASDIDEDLPQKLKDEGAKEVFLDAQGKKERAAEIADYIVKAHNLT